MRTTGDYRNYSGRARRLARTLDAAARPLGPLLRLVAPRRIAGATPRSILVVRLDHLGDVLMTTPAIAALRASFPDARLDVLAADWGRAALEGNPDVTGVRRAVAPWYDPRASAIPPVGATLAAAAGLRRDPYDWAFDFRGDPRIILLYLLPAAPRRFGFSGLGLERLLTDSVPYERTRSLIDQGLDLIAAAGVPPVARTPVFRFGEDARARATHLLSEAGIAPGRPFAAVAPAANRPPACWGAHRFAAVADGLREANVPVVLVGRREDAEELRQVVGASRHPHVDLSGRTSLADLAALLERASLLVSNDSGPAHVAAAVDCPTVAVFGPTDPALTFPYEDGLRFVSLRGGTDHALPCFEPSCTSDHGFSLVEAGAVVRAGLRAVEAGRLSGRRT